MGVCTSFEFSTKNKIKLGRKTLWENILTIDENPKFRH